MDWDWELTLEVVIPRLLEATWVTVYVTVISFLLSLVGGLIFMILKTSKNRLSLLIRILSKIFFTPNSKY